MARRRLRTAVSAIETPLDLMPMIDIVFLLLVFFILTMTFKPDEKVLSALMPAEGQNAISKPVDIPLPEVLIALVPHGLTQHHSEADYEQIAHALRQQRGQASIDVHMGGDVIVTMDGSLLLSPNNEVASEELRRVHAALAEALARREVAAISVRAEAPPITVHAWSGLRWAYVLTMMDGIRSYEADQFGAVVTAETDVHTLRMVAFAPPEIRNHASNTDGKELFRLLHLR